MIRGASNMKKDVPKKGVPIMTPEGVRRTMSLEEMYYEIVPRQWKPAGETESLEQPLPDPYYPTTTDSGTQIDLPVEGEDAELE